MRLQPAPFLAFLGGYVDTLGFLSLHGLFTAHVTGNFVTIGAALALGSSGILTKLLALPIFCIVVIATRLVGRWMEQRKLPDLRILLWAEILLLALGAVQALRFGPFPNSDAPPAMLFGMVLVSAMAIQNAVHRTHMASDAPSTLMTGSTTQILVDLVDLLHGAAPETRPALRARALRLSRSLGAFALGCAIAAGAYVAVGNGGFVLPPLVALLAWLATESVRRNAKAT